MREWQIKAWKPASNDEIVVQRSVTRRQLRKTTAQPHDDTQHGDEATLS